MMNSANAYSFGHPWYYYRGGRPLYPREIFAHVRLDGYRGFMDEIDEADRLVEPRRSERLRAMKQSVLCDLSKDISAYRACVRRVRAFRLEHTHEAGSLYCADVHTAMALKYTHLRNDFAHLLRLEDCLAMQLDLFG